MEFQYYNGKHPIAYIDNEVLLAECLERLSPFAQWAIDLEFDRNRYQYGFTMCLMQLSAGGYSYVVDSIELEGKMEPIFRALERSTVQKILHSGDEDLQLLKLNNCAIENIYDTSLAARLLNYEQMSLGRLLEEKLGVEISKKQQKSNWAVRPLSKEQILYSATDVIYLESLYKVLDKELKALGRETWQEQESSYLLQKPYQEYEPDSLSHQDRKQFDYEGQHVLKALLRFRDHKAQEFNKPPAQVLGNSFVRELVSSDLPDYDAWKNGKGIFYKAKSYEFYASLEECLETAWEESEELEKPEKRQGSVWNKESREKRNEVKEQLFRPIQLKLEKDYGQNFMRHLLSNANIDQFTGGQVRISEIGKPYASEIIRKAAEELQLDISPYW